MTEIDLSSEYYLKGGDRNSLQHGEVYHTARDARGTGSVSTAVARFYVSRPAVPAEGVHPHTRLDCFVSDRRLVSKPEHLAQLVLKALVDHGALSGPIWVSWHSANEIGGQALGDLFDFD